MKIDTTKAILQRLA